MAYHMWPKLNVTQSMNNPPTKKYRVNDLNYGVKLIVVHSINILNALKMDNLSIISINGSYSVSYFHVNYFSFTYSSFSSPKLQVVHFHFNQVFTLFIIYIKNYFFYYF